MSPRTGRPTYDPKNERIGMRLSEDESAKLHYCCEVLGLSKTEVIRKGINILYQEALKQKEKQSG